MIGCTAIFEMFMSYIVGMYLPLLKESKKNCSVFEIRATNNSEFDPGCII